MAKSDRPKRQKRHEKRGYKQSSYRQRNPQQTRLPDLTPQTDTQRDLIMSINANAQTFVFGPAGTGKTYVAARLAADMLDKREVRRIIVTRPNVAAGRSLGFFPGTLEEKIAPWAVPIIEVLEQALGKSHVENLAKHGVIEVAPLETMRGRTFDDAFVILDEAQNVTPHEIKMFLTRMGENSKLVVSGDISQSDLGSEDCGLTAALQLVALYPTLRSQIGIIEFGVDDVVRSDLTGQWVRAFWEQEQGQTSSHPRQVA